MNARARAGRSRTWALVPIRGLETAKSRLGGDLDPEERTALVTELLRRTLTATRDARHIAGTVVVTMDGAAAELARRHRAIGLVEHVPGLNAAIGAARSVAEARGAAAVLILPADLPAVSAAALDELLAALHWSPADEPVVGVVGVVADRHGTGTNALYLRPPDIIDPAFGAGSRVRHEIAALAVRARFLELDGPLALDVDTPADLLAAEAVLGAIRG